MDKLALQHVFNWSNFLAPKSPLVELFTAGIREVYWAENLLVRTLLKMKNAAASHELMRAIDRHLELTKGHASRLEQIFELLDEGIDAKKCDAIEGLAHEVEEIIGYTDDGTATRDIGIILIFQKIEHYEIGSYTGLVRLAMALGYVDVSVLLEETLEEEKESLELLDRIIEIITPKVRAEN